jgi:hypothetical protein
MFQILPNCLVENYRLHIVGIFQVKIFLSTQATEIKLKKLSPPPKS